VADLLRAPPLTEQLSDYAAELLAAIYPAAVMTCSSMGIEGLIFAASLSCCALAPSKSSTALDRSRSAIALGLEGVAGGDVGDSDVNRAGVGVARVVE
jgi:hypothetical protein